MNTSGNFYIESNQGNPRGIIFHGTLYIYALIESVLAKYLAPHKLNSQKFNALMLLRYANKGQGLSQHEIATQMIASPSNITRLLDALKKDGLVKRIQSKEDRRVNIVSISDKGTRLLDKVWPGYRATIRETMKDFSEKEIEAGAKFISSWYVQLENMLQKDQ